MSSLFCATKVYYLYSITELLRKLKLFADHQCLCATLYIGNAIMYALINFNLTIKKQYVHSVDCLMTRIVSLGAAQVVQIQIYHNPTTACCAAIAAAPSPPPPARFPAAAPAEQHLGANQ